MGALFNLMHEATGCDNCSRFVPTAAEEAAEMVETEAVLRAKLAAVTEERDRYYSTLAGVLFSGLFDEKTAKELREPGEQLRAQLAASQAKCKRLTRENAAVYHRYLGVGTTVLPGSLVMFRRWLAGDDPCTPAPTDEECVALVAGEPK